MGPDAMIFVNMSQKLSEFFLTSYKIILTFIDISFLCKMRKFYIVNVLSKLPYIVTLNFWALEMSESEKAKPAWDGSPTPSDRGETGSPVRWNDCMKVTWTASVLERSASLCLSCPARTQSESLVKSENEASWAVPSKQHLGRSRGRWNKKGQTPVCLCALLHPVSHLYITPKKKKKVSNNPNRQGLICRQSAGIRPRNCRSAGPSSSDLCCVC